MVVAGVGLIGGSLALAARKGRLVEEIVGFGRSEKNLRLAQRRGIVDRYFMAGDKIPRETDLLILGTPVLTTVPLARSFLPRLEPGCLISDVGSVKGEIVRELDRILPHNEISFVGAHPIAGSEKWGAEAATPGLFLKQRCILTPTRKTDPKAVKKLASFWRRLGAKVEIMDPNLHDRILAMVSHLPHVLAYALVNTLSRVDVDSVDLKDYCAGGFKDLTRIASSRPEIWRDICLVNRQAVSKSILAYMRCLDQLRKSISGGEGEHLEREFSLANELRRTIP
jgi:prephenate dehydrogenase